MNDDLISRSRLLRDPYFREDRYPVSHHLRMAIMEQPAVDAEEVFKSLPYVKEVLEMVKQTVAPVRHGRWEGTADGYWNGELVYDIWNCSECGFDADGADEKPDWKYCPNCGAKMDGET